MGTRKASVAVVGRAEGKVGVGLPEAAALQMIGNSLLERMGLMQRLGKSFKGRRDLYAECGYPVDLDTLDFQARFIRQDIAGRIVSAYPAATWATAPNVYETEDEEQTPFEKEWDALVQSTRLYHYILRADILSGIGRFGVLLLGVDDGKPLNTPAESKVGRKVLYLQPFGEASTTISTFDTDTVSPRYGLPEMYQVRMGVGDFQEGGQSQLVHWTRIVHLAEGVLESDVYGTPRLQSIFNRLQDMETIAAGSSEMFWKGGFQGISFEADADADFDKQAIDKMNEELQKFFMGMQRYLRLQGVKANQLTSQVASPKEHVEVQLMLISAATGLPKRILIGSEEARLAGSQDNDHWNDRVEERRTTYAIPFILQPLIARFQELGVLSKNTQPLTIGWDSEEQLSPQDSATVAKTQTEALVRYADSNAPLVVPPFQYLTHILGYTDNEAREILEAREGEAPLDEGAEGVAEEGVEE